MYLLPSLSHLKTILMEISTKVYILISQKHKINLPCYLNQTNKSHPGADLPLNL